jgi:hypothetical protein
VPLAGHGQRLSLLRESASLAEEADESVLWIELLEETNVLSRERLAEIAKEARELTAIFSASKKTAKDNA